MKKLIYIIFLGISVLGFSQEIKFGKVSKLALEEKFNPKDSIATASYLLRKRKTYFRYEDEKGFFTITEIHNRIKIYKKEGKEYSNINIPYVTSSHGDQIKGIRGYTFNLKDGKIHKEKLSRKNIFDEKVTDFFSQKKISMPNVKEGSIIDIKYIIYSNTEIKDLDFQFSIPVKKLVYRIEIPEFFGFERHYKGYYLIEPKKSKARDELNYKFSERGVANIKRTYKGNKEYQKTIDVYEEENIPALKDDEPFVVNIDNYRGGMSYELSYLKMPYSPVRYFTRTWEDVSRKIHEFSEFGGELKKTNYFKNDLANVINGSKNDFEKILKIFNFVKSKVKWNNVYGKTTQNGVKKAYKKGVGNVADINLMLIAMLREANLNANPVLISSKQGIVPIFPTIDGFNYVVAMVEFENKTYILLDATEPLSPPNILPVRALNWKGRKITKQGNSFWVTLTPPNHATEDNKIFAKINEDNTIEGFIINSLSNLNALLYRKKILAQTDEKIIEAIEDNYDLEISNFKILKKDMISQPIIQNFNFLSDNLVEEINNKLYILPLLHLTETENPFKANTREFPVDFITPSKNNISITLLIPKGYKVEKVPEKMAVGLPNKIGFFKYNVVVTDEKINVRFLYQLNKAIITPEYYKDLKEFYTKLVAKQLEKIVLIRK